MFWIICLSLLPIVDGKNKKDLLFIELIITKLLGKENYLSLYFWYAATQASLSHDSAFNNYTSGSKNRYCATLEVRKTLLFLSTLTRLLKFVSELSTGYWTFSSNSALEVFSPLYEERCNSVGPQMGFQCQPEVKCVNVKTRSGHIWRTVHYCPTLLKSSNNNNCLGVPGAEPDSENRWITLQDLIFRCDSPMQMNGWHNLWS